MKNSVNFADIWEGDSIFVLVPLKIVILRRLICFVFVVGLAIPGFAQNDDPEANKLFTADVLKGSLFAKTVDEKRFCDYVIQKRDDGTIPTRLIYGVYRKALTQDRNRRFVYFKTALEIVCKREGIVLHPTSVRTASTASPLSLSSFKSLFQRDLARERH